MTVEINEKESKSYINSFYDKEHENVINEITNRSLHG